MGKMDFEEMQRLQLELQEKYKNLWEPCSVAQGRSKLLWSIIEAGEAADIIKKEGEESIMNDSETREHFTEEMCDTFMYLNDVLICFGITPEEMEREYIKKHEKNMHRW